MVIFIVMLVYQRVSLRYTQIISDLGILSPSQNIPQDTRKMRIVSPISVSLCEPKQLPKQTILI